MKNFIYTVVAALTAVITYRALTSELFQTDTRVTGGNMDAFAKEQVVPEVIDEAPSSILEVNFGGIQVQPNAVLTPTQVKDIPQLKWAAEADHFYTVIMNDPDAPSRKTPKAREWHHWLVVNIPGNDVSKGKTLSEFVSSAPPNNSGKHRYVLAVFDEGTAPVKFTEKQLPYSGADRAGHSIKKLVSKYGLKLVAANFYQAEWDSYVPEVYKRL